jgi:hypothetical protein
VFTGKNLPITLSDDFEHQQCKPMAAFTTVPNKANITWQKNRTIHDLCIV